MKTKWIKPWEREYSLQRMEQAMECLASNYARQVMDFKVDKTMSLKLPNGNDGFFVEYKNWQRYHAYVKRIFLDSRYFQVFYRAYRQTKKAFMAVSHKTGLAAKKTQDRKKLARLFSMFLTANGRYLLIGQFGGFYLVELTDRQMTNFITRKTKKSRSQGEISKNCSLAQPYERNS